MNVTKTVKSWDKTTNKDCFGLGNPSNIDHIWPRKGNKIKGSDIKENRQRISKEANELKANNTKGKIGDYKFAVTLKLTAPDEQGIQHSYGEMFIRKPEWPNDVWHKVKLVA